MFGYFQLVLGSAEPFFRRLPNAEKRVAGQEMKSEVASILNLIIATHLEKIC